MPAATGEVVPAWFMVPGMKEKNPLLWQVSHAAPVGMWMAGLARALTAVYPPLWQFEQLPVAAGPVVPAWLIAAGRKAM